MGAMETFESMVRTSRLIYNDSVTKLNRGIDVPGFSDCWDVRLPAKILSGGVSG